MDVDRAAFGNRQRRARDDLPIRDDDQQVGLEPPQPLDRLRLADALGLIDLETELMRDHFDRRRRQPHAPAGGPIRLSDHQLYFVTRVDKGFERWHGEFGSAGENDLQEGA